MDIDSTDRLKIITLNALHNPFKLEERIVRIANEINNENADIVCLQEVVFDLDNETGSSYLNAITDITGLSVVSADPYKIRGNKPRSGTAILSRLDVCEAGLGAVPEDINQQSYNSCYGVLESESSRPIVVFSAHGVWSGDREYLRERQFLTLNAQANELGIKYSDRDPIVVLCGDFNAEPESSSLRFLTGMSSLEGEGAYWVDCWATAGDGNGITSDPLTKLNRITALNAGIRIPERIPARRIDYTLVKGWVYGRPGSPLASKIMFNEVDDEGFTPSDHYGICSELWNPRDFQ